MDPATATSSSLWPLLAYVGLVITLIAVLVGLGRLLGERHQDTKTGEPFESGVAPAEYPSAGISIEFYRVAVFFVIFDLESIFVFAWAVALRESGWTGYFEMLVFIGVLVAALIYLWRLGSLDWGTSRRRRQAGRRGGTW